MLLHGTGDKEVLTGFVRLGDIQDNPQTGTGDIFEIVEVKQQIGTGGDEKILQLLFKLWCGVGIKAAVEGKDSCIVVFGYDGFHSCHGRCA
jgi:hypothetical protein